MEKNNLAVAIMNFGNEKNIGGLIRTANAAALEEVVIVGRKKWNKAAATKAHAVTKIVKMRTTDEFIDYCQDNGYNIVSVEIGADSQGIFAYDYPERPMLVIGNEGLGVPEKVLENSVAKVYIPQYGNIECLNAATSGGIAIYDWVRKNCSLEENSLVNRKFIPK